MNAILRKISHIPSRLRSMSKEATYVIDGLIEASRDALLIRRALRNAHFEGEQVHGVAVINAGRCLPVTDVELYMAHILAANGMTVYVLCDDGVLEHWDSAQVHHLRYHSPYRARWFIRWGHAVRKHLVYWAYWRLGMKLLHYSDITHGARMVEDSEQADSEYAVSSTERFYETSLVDVTGVHREYYQKSLRNCAISRAVAKYALDVLHPDLYVTSHGIYSVWGPAYRSLEDAGVPVVVWQVAGTTTGKIRLLDRHDGLLASTGDWEEFALAMPTEPRILQEGRTLIEARVAHRTHDTKEYFGQGLGGADLPSLHVGGEAVRLGAFPNVVWDGNIPERNIMFENVVEWCLFTIDAVRDTKHHLYVRFHPSETTRLKGSVRLEDIIRQKMPDVDQLGNVTLISSSQRIDTYEFAETLVDVGLVYDGNLCLELTYMGIPVVACTNGNYTPDTIVYKPQSEDEYTGYLMDPAAILARFGNERDERISEACKYAYWLFRQSLLEFRPLEKPYPAKMNYRLVPRGQPLSADEQRMRDRLMRPLRRGRQGAL